MGADHRVVKFFFALPTQNTVGDTTSPGSRAVPLPPTENPALERRDLRDGIEWFPVAANIENLQVQYAIGDSDVFID